MAHLFTSKPKATWLVLLTTLLLIAACGPAENVSPLLAPATEVPPLPATVVATIVPSDTAYPPPSSSVAPANEPYPAPTDNTGKTLLAFNQPVDLTQTTVTGVGPPGLPVFILNLTFMGSELGAGVIDSDGTFSIQVSALEPGTRVGLTADVTNIGLTEDDVYGGAGEIVMPQVGNFYDSFVIPQKN